MRKRVRKSNVLFEKNRTFVINQQPATLFGPIRLPRRHIHVVVISGELLPLVMRRRGCASHKKMRWLQHAPTRVGNYSLNNGVTWPDGDPQSLRDCV